MAQLNPIDIIAPGRWGLNTEMGDNLLDPNWATQALNCVVNRSNRLAARKGWADQTTNAVTGAADIIYMHEGYFQDGTSRVICVAGSNAYADIDDFTDSANDLTTSAFDDNNVMFLNFNNQVIQLGNGGTPDVYTGSGVFTSPTFTGTAPQGKVGHAAFGRLWVLDDDELAQVIRYSALLDETDWSTGSGGGTITMSQLWTQGTDRVRAIASVGAALVVFGENHIVLFEDGAGSELGITPSRLQVVDIVEGTGCIARDSVQVTGEGDILFLSRHGLQSLGRVLESKSNPTINLTKNVWTDFLVTLKTEYDNETDYKDIGSTFNAEEGLYILNMPNANVMWVFDLAHTFQDPADGLSYAPVTKWQVGGGITSLLSRKNGDLLFGTSLGTVGLYSTNLDDEATYDWDYTSGWLDFGPELNHTLKMLKQLVTTVLIGSQTMTYYWEFDYSGQTLSRTFTYTSTTAAEFNLAEFNEDEFSGGLQLTRKALPAHGEGQFLRIGASATISASDIVLQHYSIAPAIGRLVT